MIGIIGHGSGVIRFLFLLLTSLSLMLSPAAAAVTTDMGGAVECSMTAAEMDMDAVADHDKMDCCTPQCTAPTAAAVLASAERAPEIAPEADSLLPLARDSMLPSVNPAANDPPPRLRLS